MNLRHHLLEGHVIPAHPLALDQDRKLDEDSQVGLTRYYLDSGAGGIAVGVHTTQFSIREAGLYRPVLELAAAVCESRSVAKVAGICGLTPQAVGEAEIAASIGYDAGLLSLGAWRDADEESTLEHCRVVAGTIPLFGFYLQPAVGGRVLSYRFWRRFLEIENVVAIKIAPFNRYQTLDVVRAAIESYRDDVALYTGNDDNIIADLLTPFEYNGRARCIVGGLLGQWAVWTRRAVDILNQIKMQRDKPGMNSEWLKVGSAMTDANAAIFDAPNGFRGCIPGIHEVLRRQGLMRGIWCLNPNETLSPGQLEEIDRVIAAYPELVE